MKSGEIMIAADTKIYYLDEIFNICLFQENKPCKNVGYFAEKKEEETEGIDPEIKRTEFNIDLGMHT